MVGAASALCCVTPCGPSLRCVPHAFIVSLLLCRQSVSLHGLPSDSRRCQDAWCVAHARALRCTLAVLLFLIELTDSGCLVAASDSTGGCGMGVACCKQQAKSEAKAEAKFVDLEEITSKETKDVSADCANLLQSHCLVSS